MEIKTLFYYHEQKGRFSERNSNPAFFKIAIKRPRMTAIQFSRSIWPMPRILIFSGLGAI